jgi:hypothetical protein
MRHQPCLISALILVFAAPLLAHEPPQSDAACAPGQDGRPESAARETDADFAAPIICGTVDFGPAEKQRAPDDLDAWVREHANRAMAVSIPVAFHVLYYTQGRSIIGEVSDAQIIEQLNVMNDAYAGTGLSFYLLSIDRTENRAWAKMITGTASEEEAKMALAVDPAHTLNIYTGNPSRALGWSYFPWSYPESSHMHGIVLFYELLPGGSYNREGISAVHEGGHYLGLYHTFQGGCSEPNDYCDDTPQEAHELKTECVEEDSCPDDPGMDPIHNYMNYGRDFCLYEFTLDQIARMEWALTTYKPSLLN